MKPNGFLSSALLYGMLALFLVVMTSTLAVLGTRKLAMDKLKEKALNNGQNITNNIIEADETISDLALATDKNGEIYYMYSAHDKVFISKDNKAITAQSIVSSVDMDFTPSNELTYMYTYENNIQNNNTTIVADYPITSLSLDVSTAGEVYYMYAYGSLINTYTNVSSGAVLEIPGTISSISMGVTSQNQVQYICSYDNHVQINSGSVIEVDSPVTAVDMTISKNDDLYYIYAFANKVYISDGTSIMAPGDVTAVAITTDDSGHIYYMYSVGHRIYTNLPI